MATFPEMLIIMRHAEKPDDPSNPDLAPEGVARANALAAYVPEQFGVPDFIFAAAISKHSARPYETVEPLSNKTGVAIDATVADKDYGILVSRLLSDTRYAGKRVIISWHHGQIPNLMNALGAPDGAYPDPWGPDVFNLILKVDFASGGSTVTAVTEPF